MAVLARATLADPDATERFGNRLARALRPGDVVLLEGPLGAGKTTLVRGLGEGLGVRGPITSPTFVIARLHPSVTGGPALVHVDAYRLADARDLDQLDLDADVERAVTVVEWGTGLAEGLAEDYLLVRLRRPTVGEGSRSGSVAADATSDGHEPREVELLGHGSRWQGVDFAALLG